MRKCIFLFCLAIACSLVGVAQEQTSKAEVFGGYQYTNVSDGSTRYNFNGWNTAFTGYFHKNVGLTADLSGAYGSPSSTSVKLHSYLFGPTFRISLPKVSPYVHALFGVSHVSVDTAPTFTDNAFAYAFGGGLDINAGAHVALRLAQTDYVGTRFNSSDFGSSNQNHFRYSTGVVFKF